jgi:hypothetical protein
LAPHRSATALLMLILAGLARADGFAPRPEAAGDLPLVLRDDFERDDLGAWRPTDPKAWRITRLDGGNRVLDQHAASQYAPPVRSPVNIALAEGSDVADFVLDLKVRSTAPDTGRRDLCFIFGYRDPTHFYYAHVAKMADANHNSIFVVDGVPRASIVETRNQGVPWDDAWHRVRVVRKAADGLIQVFFDDMAAPIMTAHDARFPHGRIGLGSFDDTGQFDDVQLWGRPAAGAGSAR